MIAAVYPPQAIVLSTVGYDTFYRTVKSDKDVVVEKMFVSGHPHFISFWDKYVLCFNQLDDFHNHSEYIEQFKAVMSRWKQTVPTLAELMPYIKKQIVDLHINVIGVMAGFSLNKDNALEPFVYQILGEDVRRINVDNNGSPVHNFIFLEKKPMASRLIYSVRMPNGDEWMDLEQPQIRCDLFSTEKAREFAEFLVSTSAYINNVNNLLSHQVPPQTVIITPETIIE